MRSFRRSAIRVAATTRMVSHIILKMKDTIRKKNDELTTQSEELKSKFGETTIGTATVNQVYGGMRDVRCMVYEPSLLDLQAGIRFRDYSIPECQKLLPKPDQGEEMLPEAMFYLLATGVIPTVEEAKALNAELQSRVDPAAIAAVQKTLDALPLTMHPMTQYSTAILTLQTFSKFHAAYAAGKANKTNFWELALEDVLDCMARSPFAAAMIYRRLKTGKTEVARELDPDLDWAANFSRMMGFEDPEFWDMLRLYLSVLVNHGGGSPGCHAAMLVGSTLSDPYLAYSAGLNALAGPLHALAAQESLTYLFEMRDKCKAAGVDMRDTNALTEAMTKFTWDLLNSRRVVPGYGHAVLRKTDPRYTMFREFCLKHFPDDELFRLVNTAHAIVPGILKKHGKTKNPFPNVGANSGVLLQHYGLVEQNFYTVLFSVSRQIGVFSGLVWDRLRGLPIERPKSTTTPALYRQLVLGEKS